MTARFHWKALVDGTDVAGLTVSGGTITYGRSSVFDQPGLPVAVIELISKDDNPVLAARWPEFGLGEHSMPSGFTDLYSATYAGPKSRITLQAPLQVIAQTESGFSDTYVDTYSGDSFTRFTGALQAIDYSWDRIRLTATPTVEAWNRIDVGATDAVTTLPAETDTARVSRYVTEAGQTITVDGTAGPTVIAVPASTAARPLLGQLEDIAQQTGGLLYIDRDGDVHYRTKNWTPPATVTLPAVMTLRDSLTMALELGTVVNTITVQYGDADPLATVTAVDTASVTAFGTRDATYTTMISGSTAAQAYADMLLAATTAEWTLPTVELRIDFTPDDATISDLLAIEQGTPVTVPQLLPGAPVPDIDSTVLGYTENVSSTDWSLAFHLAPLALHAGGTA